MKKIRLEKLIDNGILWDVYNGVIGDFPIGEHIEKMLSRFRNYGVKSLIDLKCPSQNTEVLFLTCKQFGVEYFNCSLSRNEGRILPEKEDFVKLFPKLCDLIDKGGFFITNKSMAQPLLLVYWFFHGADRGLYLSKLFKMDCFRHIIPIEDMVYACRLYDYMQKRFEKYGQAPLSNSVFQIRSSDLRQMWSPYPSTLVGYHSFLHITHASIYGRYDISLKGKRIGWIAQPDRFCHAWRYEYVLQNQTLNGESLSFDAAKKVAFDFLYTNMDASEYLNLMNITSL